MVLEKLFGSTKLPYLAEEKPIKFVQTKAKRTNQSIAQEQKEILEEAQSHGHRIIPTMSMAIEVLGRENILKAAGFVSDLSKLHKSQRDGQEAQNENLERQLRDLQDLAESDGGKGLTKPWYLVQEVWKNYRVGIAGLS